MESDDDFAREVLLRVASRFSVDKPFYVGIGEHELAALYVLMVRLFPPHEDAERATGFIGVRDSVGYLRDGIPRYLADLGTEAAVAALSELIAGHPEFSHLAYYLALAERAMRIATWLPLSPKEVLALADKPTLKLVTSPADLCEILAAALEKFGAALHGAQTPVRDLWDRQKGKDIFRPIDENALSDVITRFLRTELEQCRHLRQSRSRNQPRARSARRAADRHFSQRRSPPAGWPIVRPDRRRDRDERVLERRIVHGPRSATVRRLHDPVARAGRHLFGRLV